MLQQQLDFALSSQAPYFHMQYRWESWALVICVSEHDKEEMASGSHVVKAFFNPDPFREQGCHTFITLGSHLMYRMIQDYVLTIITGAAS